MSGRPPPSGFKTWAEFRAEQDRYLAEKAARTVSGRPPPHLRTWDNPDPRLRHTPPMWLTLDKLPRRIKVLEHNYHRQVVWMIGHGGTLAGYIKMYGLPGDQKCHGDGGEAIFTADYTALQRYVGELEGLRDLRDYYNSRSGGAS